MAKTAKKKLKKLKQPTTLRGQSDEEVLFLRQRLQDAEEKLSTAMFEPASRFDDRGVSRRRRSLEIWRARVAATMRPQRGSIRGDESRRRRGHDADIPWRRRWSKPDFSETEEFGAAAVPIGLGERDATQGARRQTQARGPDVRRVRVVASHDPLRRHER